MNNIQTVTEGLIVQIEKIKEEIITGKSKLLEKDLESIFREIKRTLTVKNIFAYSNIYKDACDLLQQKFDELKVLLQSLNKEKVYLEFLNSNPSDLEIYELIQGSWITPYKAEGISIDFMSQSRERYCRSRSFPFKIDHLEIEQFNEDFLINVPDENFTGRMINYYDIIKNKFPCEIQMLFEEIEDQLTIYENFVYLLHLLQLGIIKYQEDIKMLYCEENNE